MQILLNNLWNLTKTQIHINKINKKLLFPQRLNCTAAKHGTETVNQQHEQQPKEQKSLHISVIGVPNAGKSTFINNLINHRVCPTSSKVHTTRKSNKAIYTTGQTQLVFYDTPGLVTQKEIMKHKLDQSFKSSYRYAIQNTDMIAVIHDTSNTWQRKSLHSTVVDTLKAYPQKPSILILNKIDALKSKRITLELIRLLTNDTLKARNRRNKKVEQPKIETLNEQELNEIKPKIEFGDLNETRGSWSDFSDVFLVSATTGSGLNEVHDYLLSLAKPRCWKYPSDTFTDETPEDLIVDNVRARLLDYLPQEIPYNLKTSIEYYSVENNTIYASVEVECPTRRIERLICGESNGRLRQITERVTSDLVETFGKPISFTIATRPKVKSQDVA